MSKILSENLLRNAILDQFYDPYTGVGSRQERQLFEIDDLESKIYLPLSMINLDWVQKLGEARSITQYVNLHQYETELLATDMHPVDTMKDIFLNTRLDHDFEYFCSIGISITDKDTFVTGPFVLRGAQRKLLMVLEGMRLSNVPIRIVLLKARQWGGSTLVQFYMMWIQNRHRKNWHMAVCAQGDDAAKNIRGMYANAARLYPKELGSITLKRYEGSSKNQICEETGGVIGVGSVNNPDQFRSYNFAMSHLSEVGVWQDTPKRSAINLITSLKETVPDQPYTIVVEESTAKGLNYFYDSWIKAEKGDTRYKGVFVAWWEIDRCRIPVSDPETFVKSWNDYDRYQWSLGATIEGIAWYKAHKADKGYSDWMMMQENPATADEAFQSSGQKVFAPVYIEALRKDNCEPIFQGEVFADARIGKKAFDNIRFEKVPNGNLRIWEMPDKLSKYDYEYVVIVDIGGRTDKADNSIIRVLSRKNLLLSYKARINAILTWCGHIDQDQLAWKAAQIATIYGNALLVIEGNSLDKEEEGNHFQTVLDQIKDYYRNLYIRNDVEKVGNDFVAKYGWWTTHKNKSTAINALNASARERMLSDDEADQSPYLVENDKGVCDEMSWFETKPDGSQGAVKGKRDDKVVTTAIGVQVALNEMPLPRLKRQEPTRQINRVIRESSF